MTKDRTLEFRMAGNRQPDVESTEDGSGYDDETHMQDKELILKIQAAVAQVKQIHRDVLSSPHTDERMQNKIEDLTADIKVNAVKVRERLHCVENEIKMEETLNFFLQKIREKPIALRMKKIQYECLRKMLSDVVEEYSRVQVEYGERCRERIRQQMEIMGHGHTDAELDELLEGNKVFTDNLLSDTLETRQSLKDIEHRHQEIVKVEKSIRELNDLFLNLSLIVENQKPVVDHIEYNVHYTEKFVDKAREDLKSADKKKEKIWRRKMLLGGVLTAFVVIIILAIVV